MNPDIIGALVACVAGVLIAFINYLLSERVLRRAADKFSFITVGRQALQVGFLVAVYFIGAKTELANPNYLLVGAVVGLTLPMVFFTKKLLDVNKAVGQEKEKEKGEGDKNG